MKTNWKPKEHDRVWFVFLGPRGAWVQWRLFCPTWHKNAYRSKAEALKKLKLLKAALK